MGAEWPTIGEVMTDFGGGRLGHLMVFEGCGFNGAVVSGRLLLPESLELFRTGKVVEISNGFKCSGGYLAELF